MFVGNHTEGLPYARKIHLPQGVWSYKIGKGGVSIRTPNNCTTYKTDVSEVSGWSWDSIEKSHSKGGGFHVSPGDIKNFILEHAYGVKPPELPVTQTVEFDEFVDMSAKEIMACSTLSIVSKDQEGTVIPVITPYGTFVMILLKYKGRVLDGFEKLLADAFFALRREHLEAQEEHDPLSMAQDECISTTVGAT